MSEEVPKGSVEAGTRVRLPAGAEPPVEVYVNGVRRAEGPTTASSAATSSSPGRS